jgi:2-(1,2-epoxy-1,2-dihydrophenyl)acetyl-CoA isomerase
MKYIKFSTQNGIAQIIFNRPEVFNATHTAMREEILVALDICEKDIAVRVIYLSGVGRAFCAGQDLQEIVDPNGPKLSSILSDGYNPIVLKIRQIEKPVLCAVNGVAAGAGANIAFACDITVASTSASFTQAFSKIGLIPDSGGTWTLPRLVGMQRAAALMMLSEKLSSTDAANMGLIWKVLPDEDFMAESIKIAQNLAALPKSALALTKRALNQSFQNDFEAQLDLEDQLQTVAGNTPDYKEGVNAFLEKRKPRFSV